MVKINVCTCMFLYIYSLISFCNVDTDMIYHFKVGVFQQALISKLQGNCTGLKSTILQDISADDCGLVSLYYAAVVLLEEVA